MTLQEVRASGTVYTSETMAFGSDAQVGDTQLPFWPSKITVDSGERTESRLITFEGIAESQPSEGEAIVASINGTTVGAGEVDYSGQIDGGKLLVEAYDATRRLRQTRITEEYESTPITGVIADICNQANVYYNDAIGDIAGEGGGGTIQPHTVKYRDEPALNIIEEETKLLDAVWWVNEFNQLTVATTDQLKPGGEAELPAHQLQNVTKADHVLQLEPYDGFVVYGGAPEGDGVYNHSTQVIVGKAGNTEPGNNYRINYHTDNTISSVDEAERVARKAYQEMLRGYVGGKITVVGRPDIQPLNSVVAPEWVGGGSEYIVGKVTHTVDDNGYLTEIETAGLVSDLHDIPSSASVESPTQTGDTGTEDGGDGEENTDGGGQDTDTGGTGGSGQ